MRCEIGGACGDVEELRRMTQCDIKKVTANHYPGTRRPIRKGRKKPTDRINGDKCAMKDSDYIP